MGLRFLMRKNTVLGGMRTHSRQDKSFQEEESENLMRRLDFHHWSQIAISDYRLLGDPTKSIYFLKLLETVEELGVIKSVCEVYSLL